MLSAELKLLIKKGVEVVEIEVLNIQHEMVTREGFLRGRGAHREIGWRVELAVGRVGGGVGDESGGLDTAHILASINILIWHHILGDVFIDTILSILEAEFPVDVYWHLEEDEVVDWGGGAKGCVAAGNFSWCVEDLHSFGLWEVLSVVAGVDVTLVLFLFLKIVLCCSKWSPSLLYRRIHLAFDSFLQAMGTWWGDLVAFVVQSCTVLAWDFLCFCGICSCFIMELSFNCNDIKLEKLFIFCVFMCGLEKSFY